MSTKNYCIDFSVYPLTEEFDYVKMDDVKLDLKNVIENSDVGYYLIISLVFSLKITEYMCVCMICVYISYVCIYIYVY